MKPAPGRRFTILDAMVLVVATAAGLALLRWTWKVTEFSGSLTGFQQFDLIELGLRATFSFLATWTPALLILRLVRPRPRWRELARQPGMVACAAATLVLAWEAAAILGTGLVTPRFARSRGVFFFPFVLSYQEVPKVASVVAGAWLTLALGGRWRAEPGWVDRSGQVVGVAWLACQATQTLMEFLVAML